MNTVPYWNRRLCSDCKRMKYSKDCLCDYYQLQDGVE